MVQMFIPGGGGVSYLGDYTAMYGTNVHTWGGGVSYLGDYTDMHGTNVHTWGGGGGGQLLG